MVQTEQKAEHKPPPIEHTSPIRNTPEKHSSVLNSRTIKDITHLLYPLNESLLTLLSLLSHIQYIAMTEHTNSCNHLT